MTKIATWNVNSVKARIGHVLDYLNQAKPDILLLQEIKCLDDDFPRLEIEAMGYGVETVGQKSYNGVAILSRVGLEDVTPGFPDDEPTDPEARLLWATCGGVRIWSLYVPNGRKVGDPHYVYKLDWLAKLREAARSWSGEVALMGDWNLAPEDEDVFDITRFATSTHVTEPERAAFRGFLEDGYVDVVRPHTGPGAFTYWDYYRQRFERDRGMRIDLVLGSPELAARVTGAFVDRDERAGKGASDHAPVVVDLS